MRYVRTDGLKGADRGGVSWGCARDACTRAMRRARVFPVEEHVALLAIIEIALQLDPRRERERHRERTISRTASVDVTVRHRPRAAQGARSALAPPLARGVAAAAPPHAETIELSPTGSRWCRRGFRCGDHWTDEGARIPTSTGGASTT